MEKENIIFDECKFSEINGLKINVITDYDEFPDTYPIPHPELNREDTKITYFNRLKD